MPPDPSTAPVPLRVAAGLGALEAAAFAVLGVVYAVRGVVGRPEDRLATVLAGLLLLGLGLALLPVARALLQRRSWAVSPTVVVQLLLVVVAVGLLQGGVAAVGVPLLACAVGVLGGLFAPGSRAALGRGG